MENTDGLPLIHESGGGGGGAEGGGREFGIVSKNAFYILDYFDRVGEIILQKHPHLF